MSFWWLLIGFTVLWMIAVAIEVIWFWGPDEGQDLSSGSPVERGMAKAPELPPLAEADTAPAGDSLAPRVVKAGG